MCIFQKWYEYGVKTIGEFLSVDYDLYQKKFFNIPYIWSQYSTIVLSVSFWNTSNTWQLTEPILWNALQRVICHIILKLLLHYLFKLGALFVIMLSERTSDLTANCDTRSLHCIWTYGYLRQTESLSEWNNVRNSYVLFSEASTFKFSLYLLIEK